MSAGPSARKAQPLQSLDDKRRRIAPAPDLLTILSGAEPEEGAQCGKPTRPPAAITQSKVEMVNIAPEPPAPDALSVASDSRHRLAERTRGEQHREVHAGIDRELEGAPQPPVHLHEDVAAGVGVALAFHHGHSLPFEQLEQMSTGRQELRGHADALAVHTHPTRGRLFPQAAVAECSEHPSVPSQEEQSLAWTLHAPLQ